uniref:Uncharacterized protein n=1 Tax=Solanum tuberosum TaxID=4113 RepID=M1DR02_SOLTU
MANEVRDIKEMLDRITMELANFSVRQNQIEEQHEKSFAELKEALDAVKKNDTGKNHEETEGAGEIYTPSGQPMAWVSASQTGGAPTMVTPGGYQLGMGPLPQFQSPLGRSIQHTHVMGGGPAGHMGAGSSTHFQMHTGGQTQMPYGGFQSHPTMGIPGGGRAQPPAHGHFFNSMSRLSKIEFPRFNGVDLRSWIYKVDQYFSLDEIPPNQNVRVASLHFDGLAIEWHLAYIKSKQHHLVSEHFLELCGYTKMANEIRDIKEMLDRMTMELANFSVRQNQIEEQHEKSFAELKEALDAVKKNDKGKNHEETEGAGEIYTPSGQPMAWVSASQTGGAPTMVTPGGYQLGMGPSPQFQSPLGGSMHHTPVMGVTSKCATASELRIQHLAVGKDFFLFKVGVRSAAGTC